MLAMRFHHGDKKKDAASPQVRVAVTLSIILLLAGCLESPPAATSPTTSSPPPPFACPEAKAFKAGPINLTIDTTKGLIGVVVYGDRAPITVCNFLRYVQEDYYDGTIWHRICSHVIQTGGYDPYLNRQKAEHPPIRNEANLSALRNLNMTLGMARENESHSARSHFYINLADHPYLDWDGKFAPGYAVFGNVTSGRAVVMDIADTPTEEAAESQIPKLPPDVPVQYGPGCAGRPLFVDQTTIRDIRVA